MTSPVSMACGKQRRAAVAELHVDDLAVFIDRPIQGAPAGTNLEVRFVHAPPTADRCARAASMKRGVNGRTPSSIVLGFTVIPLEYPLGVAIRRPLCT